MNPQRISDLYLHWLSHVGSTVEGRRVLEVGCGATNAVGYALVCAGATEVWCVEPYDVFDQQQDAKLLEEVGRLHGRNPKDISASVRRCKSVASTGYGNIDLVLSHSVLEHVSDFPSLMTEMSAALTTSGGMLHIVDYRDHFFKYPLHFLQFRAATWKKFLDPGDLPRWRLNDHRAFLNQEGFLVTVLQKEEEPREFERLKSHVSPDFDLNDPDLGVTRAVIHCARSS